MMQQVGLHLQVEAMRRKTESERDLFARSAYNRYYYTVYLAVRSLVSEWDSKWAGMRHASYPEFLEGKEIAKKFKSASKQANKDGDHQLSEKLEAGVKAAENLARIMEKAYSVRVVADYNPSISVKFDSENRFSLQSIEITEAHEWDEKVQMLITSIRNAWEEI